MTERMMISSIAGGLSSKVPYFDVARHCGRNEVAVMNYDKIRNDQRY